MGILGIGNSGEKVTTQAEGKKAQSWESSTHKANFKLALICIFMRLRLIACIDTLRMKSHFVPSVYVPFCLK